MPALDNLPLRCVRTAQALEFHYVEAGTGTPLVFVHGGMGDWSSWAPQWDAFTPAFRCISYSRRYSSPNQNLSMSKHHSVLDEAQDLGALLPLWDAAPAVLVGTSYGAYTALQLALTAPQQVAALVLTEPPVLPWADSVPGGREARLEFETEVLAPSTQAFAQGDPELAVQLLTCGINGRSPGEAHTPAGRQRRLRNARAMQALAQSDQAYPSLDAAAAAALRCPILLLQGADTGALHRATTEAVARRLPQALRQQVPTSGHGVHRDNPGDFNRLVLAFLAAAGFPAQSRA